MSHGVSTDAYAFQVDLRGLVDLLSQHLYSSPRVYIRELLQNAVDATTARRADDPSAPAAVAIVVGDRRLSVSDSGVGLNVADAHQFLATIGSSSKRDDLAGARQEFLGQFGIGLLACFTVADQIRVVTRSAREPDAATVEWLGNSDGSYAVRVLAGDEARAEPGTTVFLEARRGAERWFAADLVTSLAREYGGLLPCAVTVESDLGTELVTARRPPWEQRQASEAGRYASEAGRHASEAERRAALAAYGEELLGFRPLDVIDLEVPLVGVRGAAFVLPQAASPVDGSRHRVYLKGMLLSEAAAGLLPDWAFFLRCVIDTDGLRPTASRESLYEDETLAIVREKLGEHVREWLARLAAEDPPRLAAFLRVHALGVKALARHDRELLAIMLDHLRFETTDGQQTLTEFARNHPAVYLAPTVEEFRQVAPIASAQGIGVVNGGYTYDSDLVSLLPQVLPGVTVAALDADVIAAALDPVAPGEELAMGRLLGVARTRLGPLDCDVLLRAFRPVTLPALFLDSRAAQAERTRADLAATSDGLWADILGSLRSTAPRAQLVLNYRSPLVRRLAGVSDEALLGVAVESLYGQALLMTHRPLRPADTALLNRTFGELLDRATREGDRDR
jgi:molecular chaperone HtpG